MATGRLPDPNSSPLTAKGDLYTYSTVPAKLAVGNNGETLVADSSATTGLRWQSDYAAGKNKIINGDMSIWQRGTSFSNPASNSFFADRWAFNFDGSGSTRTVSRQTFTPGTAPVAGYEGQFFLRIDESVAGSGATFLTLFQKIEDARTFAGQTVTVSFFAKTDTNRTTYAASGLTQNFGTGGSPSSAVSTTAASTFSFTTSWARYSFTVTLPSVSGKTFGTANDSFLSLVLRLFVNTTFTFDIWGVQVEAGSVATAFQTATGTLAGELAACQRYYYRTNPLTQAYAPICIGFGPSTTDIRFELRMPVTMRTTPTAIEYSTLRISDYSTNIAVTSMNGSLYTPDCIELQATVTGATAFRPYILQGNNSTSAYVAVTAEL